METVELRLDAGCQQDKTVAQMRKRVMDFYPKDDPSRIQYLGAIKLMVAAFKTDLEAGRFAV